MDAHEKITILGETINEGEKDQAVKLLKDWSAQSGFKETIFTVLEPLLIEWGKLWMQGKLSLAHGYLSGKVAEEFYLVASQSEEFLESNNHVDFLLKMTDMISDLTFQKAKQIELNLQIIEAKEKAKAMNSFKTPTISINRLKGKLA